MAVNVTNVLQRGFLELDDGWIAPFYGYQYKLTPEQQSWDQGRRICQSWGADLIVFGYQDAVMRM